VTDQPTCIHARGVFFTRVASTESGALGIGNESMPKILIKYTIVDE